MDTSLVLPTLGTLCLAAGVLMPVRDGRRGRRATIAGKGPILARFFLPNTTVDGRVRVEDPARTPECDDVFDRRPDADGSIGETSAEPNVARSAVESTARAVAADDATSSDRFPPFAVGMRFRRDAGRASDAEIGTNESDRHADVVKSTEVASLAESDAAPATQTDSLLARMSRAVSYLKRRAKRTEFAEPTSETTAEAAPSLGDPLLFDDPTHEASTSAFHDVLATLRGSNASPPPGGDVGKAIAPVSPLIWSGRARGRERAVPLTRLPLRPVVQSVTWTSQLERPEELATEDRRLGRLRAMYEGAANVASDDVLSRAWQEERGESRTLALRLLACGASKANRDAFLDALETGTDEERILAIDGLAAAGMLDDVEIALRDRADTVVARASLATCTSRRLEDHRARLDRYVDAARRENVLMLLSGLLE